MKALQCAVTGANGFVGKSMLRAFQALGWPVIALTERPELVPEGIEARKFVLGEPLAYDALKDVDVLVHTAYDFSLTDWENICRVNVVGSDYLFDAATRAGIKRQIFISSLAAFEGCRSHYGLAKLAAEEAVRVRGGATIRPGMIYNAENGGLAGKIMAFARRFRAIPMIGRGDQPLFTCHIDDLCGLVVHLAQVEKMPKDILVAAHPSAITLLKIVETASAGKPRLILMIPWRWLVAALWLAEGIGLHLPFRSDSVVSLAHANPRPDFEAIKKLPVQFRAFSG
jgi:nucleoside-diphosphate-sugar epimerase